MDATITSVLKMTLDIGIVTFIVYKVLMVAQGTKTMQVLKAILSIIVFWVISGLIGLESVKFLLTQVITYGIFGVFVIFQPELRSALENMGKKGIFGVNFQSSTTLTATDKTISALVSSAEYLSERHIGALINIERSDSLQSYIDTGIELDAKVSKELLENIFTPNVPLHDGALILRGNRIVSASCYLPLSERDDIPKELGTRHRAGIGLSEATDAFTLIVSEETGGISVTINGDLHRGLTISGLRNLLEQYLKPKVRRSNDTGFKFKNLLPKGGKRNED